MSDLNIKQQDAHELKSGYPGWFRGVEIISIASFWLLTFAVAWKVSAFAKTDGWLIVAGCALGFILADFTSGFVHWMADTWGSTNMPVLGKSLIRPFRLHHVDPKAMTKHDYVETNGANCMIALPWAIGAFLTPLNVEGWVEPALFFVVSITSMIFWVMMTNQIHKWSHFEQHELSPVIRWAQKLHLILPPAHHDVHHTAPYDKYYCITTGWLNWPLTKLGFFKGMERLVTAVTGLVPRQDDIGLDAALKIAPVTTTPAPNSANESA